MSITQGRSRIISLHSGGHLEEKNLQISISQKWFEISTPNFYQLLTSIGTHFVQNFKAFGAWDLDFPPKV